jgi:mercuric ion transport protein
MSELRPEITSQAEGTGKRRAMMITSVLAAVVAAGLASICCVGPLLIALVGIGSAGFTASVDPYRPYLIAVTLGLLAVGFYMIYRPRRAGAGGAADPCGEHCERPRFRRISRISLWAATALILLLLTFPYYEKLVEPYLVKWLL